jgi:hypothetical protein
MLTRSLAILLAPWLPLGALIFPLSPAHRISALVAGVLVTVLSAFAFSSERARVGAAVVSGLVALTALVFTSTMLEETMALSWGAVMFALLTGPLSAPPVVTRTAAAAPAPRASQHEQLPMAA